MPKHALQGSLQGLHRVLRREQLHAIHWFVRLPSESRKLSRTGETYLAMTQRQKAYSDLLANGNFFAAPRHLSMPGRPEPFCKYCSDSAQWACRSSRFHTQLPHISNYLSLFVLDIYAESKENLTSQAEGIFFALSSAKHFPLPWLVSY